ncbi:type I polyketide synthase [Flavobacterium sp. LC2016-13]|uniref:type I polyketide synthase n=1 Tax=Flavobacterium sp. LC2016-13 TaxID=2675875 RepID=UPI0012B71452|nr:type I polyketide synthase [Flavobacterium sp. LC2016-13]MTD72515.1 acyltransferase domain-containing protein [Flavobacterium sp. LC2016-13]
MKNQTNSKDIAIIGISGKFPKSRDVNEFWKNLIDGVELTTFFSDDELKSFGMSDVQINDPNFIGVESSIESETFDYSFFGYTQEEASLMDPQIRLFHEQVWVALEDAGCNPHDYLERIGIFVAANDNLNWRVHALTSQGSNVNPFYLNQISDKNYISTLISYKLNLKGPSYYIDTACSSSLTAVHLACRNLLLRECSVAIAGGIRINTLKERGYFYQEGMIFSKDGHCRSFDANASGTISGEGIGVVVLKRLDDAIRDKDSIYAVIKASAVNNDGSNKIGYTSPSVDGQANCIKLAHAIAGIPAASISYIETHGTATKLGDPIEIEALNKAFNFNKEKHCALGSVKSNMGHLSAAAGIAGLIKTALSLKHKIIPPSLNYDEPNPNIDFKNGPFYVNQNCQEWKSVNQEPLRAGVSSFGIGGTNAHIVLEEFSTNEESFDNRPYKIVRLSAKSSASLQRYKNDLIPFLKNNPEVNLSYLSYTLHTTRAKFDIQDYFVCANNQELIDLLKISEEDKFVQETFKKKRKVVFMFPGGGTQFINMGYKIYLSEPYFKKVMDEGFDCLKSINGKDFKKIIFNESLDEFQNKLINDIENIQPLLFLFEYSLAKLFIHWGVKPDMMIGHSLGEYVAACVSGVFTFEDALQIISARGRLMSQVDEGCMLSIGVSAESIPASLLEKVSIAAINSPDSFVASGTIEQIVELEKNLSLKEVPFRRLKIAIASHSEMMNPILEDLKKEINKVKLSKAEIPFISNFDGKYITNEQAISVEYWGSHLKNTVNFSKGIKTLLEDDDVVFIEVGPGTALTTFLQQNNLDKIHRNIISMNLIKHPFEEIDDNKKLMQCVGELWKAGIDVNWNTFYEFEKNFKISAPSYSFEKNVFPVRVDPFSKILENGSRDIKKAENVTEYIYNQKWKQVTYLSLNSQEAFDWTIVFVNDSNLSKSVQKKLKNESSTIFYVKQGEEFVNNGNEFYINIFNEDNYKQLFDYLSTQIKGTCRILHLWNTCDEVDKYSNESLRAIQYSGYFSILNIARSFELKIKNSSLTIDVVISNLFKVFNQDEMKYEKSTVLGALKVIPKEYPQIKCNCIEYDTLEFSDTSNDILNLLILESNTYRSKEIIAYRKGELWEPTYEMIEDKNIVPSGNFKKNGTYLITGGNGGIARVFSEYLVNEYDANLILVGRTYPEDDYLEKLNTGKSKIIFIESDLIDKQILESKISLLIQENELELNGIIHSAGVADFYGLIQDRTNEECENVFVAKILGTKNLYDISLKYTLDFFVMCSSNSSLMAPFGQVGYIAANIFQNYFAQAQRSGNKVISILWDAWKEGGMAIDARKRKSINQELKRYLDQTGITNAEGIKLLEYSILYNLPNFIVSTKDLENWINDSKNLTVDKVIREVEKATAFVKVKTERPLLKSKYIAPTTETEKILCKIWQDFFGIKDIGINDSFFEIGGDSLKAMTIMNTIKKTFGINISLKEMFVKPTIYFLAENIDAINNIHCSSNVDEFFNEIKI